MGIDGEEYIVLDIEYQEGDLDEEGNDKLSDLYLGLNEIDQLLFRLVKVYITVIVCQIFIILPLFLVIKRDIASCLIK
jgi:hypothetical protein